jgi:hypothetical protein
VDLTNNPLPPFLESIQKLAPLWIGSHCLFKKAS